MALEKEDGPHLSTSAFGISPKRCHWSGQAAPELASLTECPTEDQTRGVLILLPLPRSFIFCSLPEAAVG